MGLLKGDTKSLDCCLFGGYDWYIYLYVGDFVFSPKVWVVTEMTGKAIS